MNLLGSPDFLGMIPNQEQHVIGVLFGTGSITPNLMPFSISGLMVSNQFIGVGVRFVIATGIAFLSTNNLTGLEISSSVSDCSSQM